MNEVFCFVFEVKIERGVVFVCLIGIINIGNDVGWLCLLFIFEYNGKI